ncbi:hypothetical protein GALMADRAFT_274807 [Galerina marginata CBS 339.88]|uniref:Uncharacterized protein n=1 Tax=Galerina marginata (strain CBS 339.88) TaxID=685588 RepID=A0A067TSI5_GALM3|nr:hypothetical protein GALMADRAFT_274807 [Galerina marginata CBS 339.88]
MSVKSSKLLQILDDSAAEFQYSGGEWTVSTLVEWYQGTSMYPAFANSTLFGTLTLSFEGNTPGDALQSATVSIDGGQPYTIIYSTTTPPPAYIQWYQSPTLSDGKHTITLAHLDRTAVDCALVEVGQNTPLIGKTILVDNDDPAIQYSGTWTRDVNEFDASTLPDGFPLQNSTHRSSTLGDTVKLRFSGTFVAVYGIFDWAKLGLLSATYTLDGDVLSQSYPVTTTSERYQAKDRQASNFLYFSQENLPPGDHTLVVNITEAQNQTFILDYITYMPSFSTLSTMLNLTTSASPSSPTISSSEVPNASLSATPTQSGLQGSHNSTNLKTTLLCSIAGDGAQIRD